MRRVLTVLAVLMSANGAAQTYQGGVRGAVRDATGIIPGAAVTLLHPDTNQSRQTHTNDVGQYVLANVPPGMYTLSVYVDGFKPYEQTGIEVRVQDFHVIDVLLELGTVEETVVVTGETPLIDTASASVGSSIEAAEMVVLPTPARNPFFLAVTTPNVVPTGNPQFQRMQDQERDLGALDWGRPQARQQLHARRRSHHRPRQPSGHHPEHGSD